MRVIEFNFRHFGRFIALPLLLAGVPQLVHAQAYEFDWNTLVGGVASDSVAATAVAPDGSIAVTGRVEQDARVGTVLLSGPDSSADGFVAKLDSDGNVDWANRISGPGYDEGRAITVDRSGNVWVTGSFHDTANFAPGTTLTSVGPADAFVAKYAADGALLFVRQFGGDRLAVDYGTAIDTDAAGDAYLALYFQGTVSVAGATFTPPDIFSNPLVIKLAGDGTPRWAVHFAARRASIEDISVDSAGSVAFVGSFEETLSAGGASVRSAGRTDVFTGKLASDGSITYLVGTGGSSFEDGYGVEHLAAANIVISGSISGNTTIFGERLATSLGRGFFVARLDAAGRPVWTTGAESTGSVAFQDVTVDSSDNVIVGGTFVDTIRLGTETLAAPGRRSAGFLAVLDSAGALRSLDRVQALAAPLSLESATTYGPDSIVLAGRFANVLTLDGLTIRSRGGDDGWIAAGSVRPVPPEPDPYGDGVTDLGELGSHIHWRCSRLIRRALLVLNLPCPGVFEHAPAPRSAEDIFSVTVENATLARVDEVDEFSFRLPDITDARWGDEHADIRPETSPFRAPEPEILEECFAVQRLSLTPPGLGSGARDTIYVTTAGRLSVLIEPTTNMFASSPVSLTGERLRLYAGGRLLDDITVVDRDSAAITCPMDLHDLDDVRVTFGEREEPRDDRSLGGYRLEIEYRIDANRGIPDWAASFADARGSRTLPPAACPPGRFGSFPRCGPGLFPRFEMPHPRLPTPDCIADGPGCMELSWFRWDGAERFELAVELPPGVEMRVLDVERQPVAMAAPTPGANLQERGRIAQWSADIEPGLYFLEVTGPPSRIDVSAETLIAAAPPDKKLAPFFSPLRIAALAMLAFLLGLFVARLALRR